MDADVERFLDSPAAKSLLADPSLWFRIADLQGRYLYVSPQVERLLGYAPDELTAEVGFGIMHPDDREWAQRGLAELAKGPMHAIYRLRHKDGSWVWVNTHAQMVDDIVVAVAHVVPERLEGRRWTRSDPFL